MKELVFDWIKRPDGTSEFMEYMAALPIKDRAKLYSAINRVEEHGLEEAKRMKWAKKLSGNISELRSIQGSDIQRALYFHEVGSRYLITHGFTKKTDKVPAREIEHAKRLRDEYLRGDVK
ncbi:MAG: type II toxin-antitoxin system RelE/ParE family toxin [Coriobacteriia bacterium]|nr:type II toxin-antitoxin system RelE/ParE family toxin [Coriobacteriia bacterium]